MLSTELRLFPGSPSQFRCMSGAEPNATFRVAADGETGDFKGLTLSNSSPVHSGSGAFLSIEAKADWGKADMSPCSPAPTVRIVERTISSLPRPERPDCLAEVRVLCERVSLSACL